MEVDASAAMDLHYAVVASHARQRHDHGDLVWQICSGDIHHQAAFSVNKQAISILQRASTGRSCTVCAATLLQRQF
jgi:hypothetical protein